MEGDGGRGSSYGGGGGRSTSHTPPPPRYTSSSSSHPHAHYPTTTSSDHDYFGGGGGGRGGLQPQPVAGVPSPSALPLLMLDQASLLSLSAQQLQQALYQQLLLPPLALPLAQPPAAAANPFHPNALQRSYAEEDVGYGRAALPHPQRHGKDGQSHAAAATATLCRDFQSGRCQRGSVCKYAHVREVCADFRQGKCQRGATCKYLHPSPYSSSVSAYSSSPYLTTPTTGSAVGVGGARPGGEYCRDFRRGGCARGDLCRYVHAGSSSVEMCRDYQRGECSRGSSCKFLHELPERGRTKDTLKRKHRDNSEERHNKRYDDEDESDEDNRHDSHPSSRGRARKEPKHQASPAAKGEKERPEQHEKRDEEKEEDEAQTENT
ncbi:hypothetical protein QOT17_011822 [Balamuthia mandrillaris]